MAVRAITHRTETYTVTLAVRCADKGREREDELHHREERRAEQREKWEGTACGVCVGRHPTVGGQSGTRSWRALQSHLGPGGWWTKQAVLHADAASVV